jgi:hypothetical protein
MDNSIIADDQSQWLFFLPFFIPTFSYLKTHLFSTSVKNIPDNSVSGVLRKDRHLHHPFAAKGMLKVWKWQQQMEIKNKFKKKAKIHKS